MRWGLILNPLKRSPKSEGAALVGLFRREGRFSGHAGSHLGWMRHRTRWAKAR